MFLFQAEKLFFSTIFPFPLKILFFLPGNRLPGSCTAEKNHTGLFYSSVLFCFPSRGYNSVILCKKCATFFRFSIEKSFCL